MIIKRPLFFATLLLFYNLSFAQYTDDDIYGYIEQYKELAVAKMHEYKIPASITLAQGIFESACGTSRLAVEGNNHFGIKCHKEWDGDTIIVDDDEQGECFRKYEMAEDSYDDHSLFLTSRPRYNNLFKLDVMDYKAWAHGLKAAGYATNPKYAERLISLIERFNIAEHDTVYLYQIQKIEITADESAQKEKKNGNDHEETAQESETKMINIEEHEKMMDNKESQQSEEIDAPMATSIRFLADHLAFPVTEYPFTDRICYSNNKILFVIAGEGDTYASIALDVQDNERNIRRFNDAEKQAEPIQGEVVYIEAKAKNNLKTIHTVAKGESLRFISQKYAVQLYYIFRYNQLSEDSIIHPGNQIKLKP